MQPFDYNKYLKNNPLLKEGDIPTRQMTGDDDADWMGEAKDKEKDIEVDIDSAEQITLKGRELDSDKLGTDKKYRDIILKAPEKAFIYKGKPASITAVDLNDGSVDEPKIYLTVLNESTKTTRTLKSTKPGDKLTLVLDDNSTATVVRVGSNKSGEPTFNPLATG